MSIVGLLCLLPLSMLSLNALSETVEIYKWNVSDSSPSLASLLDVYDFACGPAAFCNKSLSTYSHIRYDCIKCQPCRCDDSCYVNDDCCIDKALRLTTSTKREFYTRCVNPNVKECGGYRDNHYYYRIIDTCPAEFQNIQTREKCQSNDKEDYSVSLPVTSGTSGVTYKNRFCAECHYETDVMFWSAQIQCDRNVLRGLSSISDIWREAVNHCCFSQVEPPSNASVRHCRYVSGVSTCPQTRDGCTNTSCELCDSVTAEVFVYNHWTTYRNIYCALCNNVILRGNASQTCVFRQPPERSSAYSLHVLLHFKPHIQTKPKDAVQYTCAKNEILDPLSKQCRRLQCESRHVFDGDTCVSVYRSAKGLTYSLRYILVPNQPLFLRNSEHSMHIYENCLNIKLHKSTLNISMSFIGFDDDKEVQYIYITLSLTPVYNVREDEYVQSVMNAIFESAQPPCVEYSTPKLTVPVSLESYIVDRCSETDVFKQLVTIKTNANKSFIVMRTTNVVKIPYVECDGTCVPPSGHIVVPLQLWINKCPYLQYKQNDVTVDKYSGVLRIRDVVNLAIREDEYEICGDVIKVCESALSRELASVDNRTTDLTNQTRRYDHMQSVASLTATTLSLTGHAGTLVTYSLFSELRTVPGMNIMCLVVHMFAAQLLLQLANLAIDDFTICALIGIAIHYLWQAVFAWMAVISYHMFYIFRKFHVPSVSKVRKLVKYGMYANGLAGVVTGACVIKNVVTSANQYAGYGNSLCFITNGNDVAIFMIGPLAAVIIVNIIFFTFTILSIRSSTTTIHASLNKERHHVSIYIKLSALLGFTWLFGILAAVLELDALWYLFIATSGCQGLYIFVAYCCKRRVLHLYKSKFCVQSDHLMDEQIRAHNTTKSSNI